MTLNVTVEHSQEGKELAHIICQVHIKPYSQGQIVCEAKGHFIWQEMEHEPRNFPSTNKHLVNVLYKYTLYMTLRK